MFRKKYSFQRPSSDFRLSTGDIEEGHTFWYWIFHSKHGRRARFSRYIAAGGARHAREDEGEAFTLQRSWTRFTWAVISLIILWFLGYFL